VELPKLPLHLIRWDELLDDVQPGAAGAAVSSAVQWGDFRLRRVRYEPGFRSDHRCAKGHIVHVLEGALTLDLEDGRSVTARAGESIAIGESVDAHLAWTETGATVIIID
jgi:quercetin dioxygenase-like cupin family protein